MGVGEEGEGPGTNRLDGGVARLNGRLGPGQIGADEDVQVGRPAGLRRAGAFT
jgi:hypothetical protein